MGIHPGVGCTPFHEEENGQGFDFRDLYVVRADNGHSKCSEYRNMNATYNYRVSEPGGQCACILGHSIPA